MTSPTLITGAAIDVAVIGGGPAGLAAATVLKRAGIARVCILERDPDAGGIPRHCGHPPFGMREFKRILRGPEYAARLVNRALNSGVEIFTNTTVIEAHAKGNLRITTPSGVQEISARRVIYATGVREKPRSARFITGPRVQGVMNTGALQSMIYLQNRRPFRRPVIIGTELVAFSAIMTCRHAGIKPVAMIEQTNRVTARWPSGYFPMLTGVKLFKNTRLVEITGQDTVDGVIIQKANGANQRIDCDGVILSGQFTPESTLARSGHLTIDPATGGPAVDQFGRCSDPAYFATGNVLRPVETAGWSWQEAVQTGQWVADDLAGKLPAATETLPVHIQDPRIKYVMPQRIVTTDAGMKALQLRVTEPVNGMLTLCNQSGEIRRQKINAVPERRLLIPISGLNTGQENGGIHLDIL